MRQSKFTVVVVPVPVPFVIDTTLPTINVLATKLDPADTINN